MKCAIIETWNGEGYSTENKAKVHEFKFWKDARDMAEDMAFQLACGRLVGTFYDTPAHVMFGYDFGDDQGAVQVMPLAEDTFGCVILCNINDAVLVDADAYRRQLDEAVAQADPEDLKEVDLTAERVFIPAYKGEYDYQFVRFKHED
jgi:hypothetical protein